MNSPNQDNSNFLIEEQFSTNQFQSNVELENAFEIKAKIQKYILQFKKILEYAKIVNLDKIEAKEGKVTINSKQYKYSHTVCNASGLVDGITLVGNNANDRFSCTFDFDSGELLVDSTSNSDELFLTFMEENQILFEFNNSKYLSLLSILIQQQMNVEEYINTYSDYINELESQLTYCNNEITDLKNICGKIAKLQIARIERQNNNKLKTTQSKVKKNKGQKLKKIKTKSNLNFCFDLNNPFVFTAQLVGLIIGIIVLGLKLIFNLFAFLINIVIVKCGK